MKADTSERGTTISVAPEWTTVTLNCPRDVGGSHVPTWSTDEGELQQDEQVYVSPVDKTLTITFVLPSESGLYYCDGKPAAYLTVTEETTRLIAPKLTTVILNCPPVFGGYDFPTWSKDGREVQQNERVYVSPVNKTLTIRQLQPRDSGLYYCDDKPAVHLTVMEAETSNRAAPHLWQTVRLVIGGLYLIIMISITATVWTKARQEQKRRATQRENDV
ncbi:hemicentin-1-like [Sparus aurata]|uniref:hemicentin-1-like n=1 Tax=Sparus aurata TaxID=8175 RepID=UPI0011C16B62|nr:hemicentin-1-like [Sparus aurata]